MKYREVLGAACKIVWKHKTLWLFGLVGMLVGLIFVPFVFIFNPTFAPLISKDLAEVASQPWFIFVPVAIEFLMLLVIYPVNSLMTAATDLGTLRANAGAEKLSFKDTLKDSLPFFWRVLGIEMAYMVLSIVIVMIIAVFTILITVPTMGLGMFCAIPLMFLIMPVMYLLQALMEQAVVAVVADNLRLIEAVKRAWALLKKNFWPVVLMIVILYFGVSIVSMIFAMPMVLPFFALPFILSNATKTTPYLIAAGACFLAYLPVFAVISSVAVAFMRSAWTLTYLHLTRQAQEPVPVDLLNA